MAKKKSLDEMRDEAYRRQDNLASDIDELIDRVHPKNAVMRWKNEINGKNASTLPAAIAGGVIGVVLIGAGIAAAVALSGGEEKAAKKSADAKAKAAKQKAKARAAKD